MGRTILEELTAIQLRIRDSISVATIEAELRSRLYVVTTLLEKGWPTYQFIEPLIAQFGTPEDVPDCPVPPLSVPEEEYLDLLREASIETEEELAASTGPVHLGGLKVIEVTERGLEKIFRGDCEDHRIYGYLTVQVCGVQAEFRHDEAMICVMLTDYPDRENDLAGEPLVIFDTVTLPVGGRMTMMLPVIDRLVNTDGEGRLGWPVRIRVA